MTSAAPEKVGPVAEQATPASTPTSSAGPSDAPRAPVPLPVVARDPATTGLPDGEPPLLSVQQMQVNPQSIEELLACSDWNIRFLCGHTSPDGKLMTVLKTAFEADWFKAKSCLVFDKWPQGLKPRFSHEMSLQLMTALTVLRGEVHKRVIPEAQNAVRAEMATRAAKLKGNQKLAEGLTDQKGIKPAEQVVYKGSVGADTVTSDVDVSTGGKNSELAVRAYNETFRKLVGVTYDPGTVFDLNVYAMDFIHGFDDANEGATIIPKAENAEKLDDDKAAGRDREQDIWALVHVARYMPADADWDAYVLESVKGLSGKKEADQRDRLATARRRAKGFEYRLLSMMEHLCKKLDVRLGGKSSWGKHEEEHFEEGALRMRAANRLYEDKLLQVKEIRLQIETARDSLKGPKPPEGAAQRLQTLISRLDGELSMAQLYANEVYGSGGATVHAVLGMQVPKALTEKRGKKVQADIPKPQWYAAFNDNLGDVLKDFEHYGKADHGTPDHWYAAFKMGKYAHRMVDALPHLATGAADDLMATADLTELLASADVVALQTLAEHHLDQKGKGGGKDPITLKNHAYFGVMNEGRLGELRTNAITLGAKVRAAVARKGPETEVPTGPVRGADITPLQFEKMRADLDVALRQARAITAEAEGPASSSGH
ncbi:hypothetical protein GCM10009795_013090 [Nocardioides hankookensis]|uniref:Uncharacterized protein n=1 Tax=Nocardioides hankookensis TaxID=443157 RepID=A0ABW1LK38_9ACTN